MDRTAALLDELGRYEPADELERRHYCDLRRLLETASDPFSRTLYDPGHVTASLFIIDGAGRLLLHHHRRLDRWLQMGGHLEWGESPAAAALREGGEESGLHDLSFAIPRPFDLDVHLIPAGRGEPEHRHFDVRYLAQTEEPESITIDAAESVDLLWVSLDRAAAMMDSGESRRVIRKITEVACTS